MQNVIWVCQLLLMVAKISVRPLQSCSVMCTTPKLRSNSYFVGSPRWSLNGIGPYSLYSNRASASNTSRRSCSFSNGSSGSKPGIWSPTETDRRTGLREVRPNLPALYGRRVSADRGSCRRTDDLTRADVKPRPVPGTLHDEFPKGPRAQGAAQMGARVVQAIDGAPNFEKGVSPPLEVHAPRPSSGHVLRCRQSNFHGTS